MSELQREEREDGEAMKTIAIILIVGAAACCSTLDQQLEEIAANWFSVGQTCGHIDELLALADNPGAHAKLDADDAACSKWRKRFHVKSMREAVKP